MFSIRNTAKAVPAFALIAAIGAALAVTNAQAGTLENLERERALFVETFLDPGLSVAKRQQKIATSKARLIDLERMVIRDKSLEGRNTPTVRIIFANYDLSFLVHASAEKNVTVVENWLTQLGVTTQTIMTGNVGPR